MVAAAAAWVDELRRGCADIVRVGYFGSYARGDYVPGSDFDVMIELAHCDEADPRERAFRMRPARFPVAMDLFVYTTAEIETLRSNRSAFLAVIEQEFQPL